MDQIINEKTYPIRGLWLWKITVKLTPIFLFFGLGLVAAYFSGVSLDSGKNLETVIVFTVFVAVIPFSIIVRIIGRMVFHYSFDQNYITVKQGIITRTERHIPYAVIQDILVKQDLLDRMFNICTIVFENISSGAEYQMQNQYAGKRGLATYAMNVDTFGSFRNKVFLPGLRKEEAQLLRKFILDKIKENPATGNTGGI